MTSAHRGSFYQTVHVPVSLVGLLIGKKGANIKEINDRSRARCWVDNTKIVKGCKVVEITGKDLKSVTMARQIIESQIRQFKTIRDRESGYSRFGAMHSEERKEKQKSKENQEFVNPDTLDGEDYGDYVFQSDNDEEEESTNPKEPKEDSAKSNIKNNNSKAHAKMEDEEQKLKKRGRKGMGPDRDIYLGKK